MAPKPKLTFDRLVEVLSYEPATELFQWKAALSQGTRIGAVAGWTDRGGYRRIKIDGKNYAAHRLAWFYVHGVWPTGDLDHKDTIKHNNRIDNLRPASRSQNGGNRQRYRRNTSGYKGVRIHRGYNPPRWVARIQKDRKYIHIGAFASPQDAHAAYYAKARELFGEFANSG